RGGGAVRGESAFGDVDDIVGAEPGPEFAAQMADECGRLLERLDDAELRAGGLGEMGGYTNPRIADPPRARPPPRPPPAKVDRGPGGGAGARPPRARWGAAPGAAARRRHLRPVRGRLARR